MWVLFRAPTPTPDGRTAKDLYEKRIPWTRALAGGGYRIELIER